MFMIALFCVFLAFLAVLILRPPRPIPDAPDYDLVPDPRNSLPPQTIPVPTRHVSFSPVGSDSSHSPPISPSVPFPIQRRWSSPFHKRRPPAPDAPRAPQPYIIQTPVDQFGRLSPSPSPSSYDTHSSPKSARRLSTPLRLSLPGKRRSLIHIDQVDTHARSPPFPTSPPLSSRTRFANPFSKHSRSRTLSPPDSKASDILPSYPSGTSSPSTPPAGRRTLVNKFKSIFKPVPPEPSPNTHPKPVTKIINTRFRRKPAARTQPYGPPWNAPMPAPDFTLSQHPFQTFIQKTPPPPQTSRKHSVHASPLPERTSMSSSQLSPRTFINELDEKLTLLQHQRIQDLIPSPHG